MPPVNHSAEASPPQNVDSWESRSHEELVFRIQEGDTRALTWVFNTYRPSLLRYARQILGFVAEPEDIVQEAFARFWARRAELRPDGSIRALLFISVRTIARDEYRAWGSRVVLRPELQHCRARGWEPLEEVMENELRRSFKDAFSDLSPRRKQVFRLVRDQGLSHAETANVLGITTRTVKNTMSSALSELRDRLEVA